MGPVLSVVNGLQTGVNNIDGSKKPRWCKIDLSDFFWCESHRQTLEAHSLPHRLVKTWTTDAPYRETQKKVESRRAEGCSVVEMETASLMAAAQFRDVIFGQVLYGGDDLSGAAWDNRGWQSRAEIRENLFWLAVEACLSL